jgi:outer membrane receptor for ferrienterochelin and colicins
MYSNTPVKRKNHISWLPEKLFIYLLCWMLTLMLVSSVSLGNAQEDIELEEDAFKELEHLLKEDVVAIASKIRETVAQAPATVTVITATDIRNMGARTLTEVLQTIPGVEVFIKEYGYHELVLRGGRRESQRVKFLLNEHSTNPSRTGQPAIFLDDLTIENIKRIEIIRGPGSALYGTNAFNGVINIITKDADDINGYEINAKGGSNNTWQAGILFGQAFDDLKISGYGEYAETDGPDSILEQDAQTVLDQMYAPYGIPPVSLAPGEVNAYREKTDINFDLSYRDLTLRTKYLKKVNGPYVGANYTLNNDSKWNLEYVFLEGHYTKPLHEKFDLSLKLSWDRETEDYSIQGYPEGFTIPLDLDGDGDIEIFPDGARGRLATSFDTFGGELQGIYRPIEKHTVIGGVEVQEIRQFDNAAESNFARLTLAALDPGVLDTSPSFEDNTRTVFAVFLQDQWKITANSGLTLGIRHDHYSDFGDSTNPRVAFVWRVIPDLHLKVLYGNAFLAPSFHETYLMNNPLIVGSRDLQPVTIQTFEIGATYAISEDITGNIAYFYNKDDDVIIPEVQPDPTKPATFVNAEGDIVQGIELELKADFEDRFQGYVNYTFRETDVQHTHDDVPFVSRHLARCGVNIPVSHYFNANIQTSFVGERPRETGDERDPVESYMLVDTTLTAKNFYKGLELFVSVYNLFDEEYFHPSLANSFPGDYPMPGRTFLAGVRYKLSTKE